MKPSSDSSLLTLVPPTMVEEVIEQEMPNRLQEVKQSQQKEQQSNYQSVRDHNYQKEQHPDNLSANYFATATTLATLFLAKLSNNGLIGKSRLKVYRKGCDYWRSNGCYCLALVVLGVAILNIANVNAASISSSTTTNLDVDLLPTYHQVNNDSNGHVAVKEPQFDTSSPSAPLNDVNNNVKRTILHHTSQNEQQEHTHKINITLPLEAFEKPPIIVKHRNVIYEVVDNGTISTSYGTISIPIITAPVTLSASDRIRSNSVSSERSLESMTATIYGFRVEQAAKGVSYDEHGVSKILANSPVMVRFFGKGFTNNTIVRFVMEEAKLGDDCDDFTSTKYFHFDVSDLTEFSAVVQVSFPPLNGDDQKFYVCIKEEDNGMPWVHQGTKPWLTLTSYQKWLPLWAHIVMLVCLLALSGLFSGLNLGLMAIDTTEIKIIMNAGSEKERRYAKQIRPLRENGNYLLCSLLLGNVLVNATLTILLDDISSGLVAVVGSTVGIVVFGEIVPQAVCSRHGLAVGAKTVWITKFFMAVTFILSYPISVILDKVLGKELGNVYNRERLKELIRVTEGANDLEKQEVNIISGALDLKQKTVVDVMTKLDEVYMLPIDAVLDFDTVSEIMSNGYSRIPVYEGQRGNVVSLLYTKDLAFVDPDDNMPLRTICEFYSNACHFVFENVTLNVLFNVFKQGNKGHMAFVQRVKESEKVDPTYEVVGLVTMEDIIEELIQEEINDETDVWELSNKRYTIKNYDAITNNAISRLTTEGTTVSPQLTLAAFQYLSTVVEEFNDLRISKTVLERLLKQNIYFHVKIKNKDTMKTDPNTILFERGKPADYFIMILEGKVHAEIGKESLLFEGGPFTFFGANSLALTPGETGVNSTPLPIRRISQASIVSSDTSIQPVFIPDYTVRAVTDLTYFKISRSMYQSARQATLLEKTYNPAENPIEEEIRNNLDDVDGTKTKEKPLTVGKPTARGSISEARSY